MTLISRIVAATALAVGLTALGSAVASADPINADAVVSSTVDVGADVVANVDLGLCIRIGNLVVIGCTAECPEAEAPEAPRGLLGIL